MKKISVIVPCYNAENYVDRCMNSIVSQTMNISDLEIILVNDASTDTTLFQLLRWEKKYPDDITVINCEQNGKQGTARNIGIRHASCDYIGFIDIDDWIDVTMYEKLYEKAIQYDCDIVGCLCDRVYSPADIHLSSVERTDRFFSRIDTVDEHLNYFNIGIGEHVVCKIYRRSIIIDNDIFFPENLSYEDNYWGELLNFYIHNAYMVNEVLYHWFSNMNSTSVQRNSTKHLDRLYIERLKLDEFKRRGLYEKYKLVIDIQFLTYYYLNSLHTFFTRFTFFPIELFKGMQYTVMELLPDYEETIKRLEFPPQQMALFDLIPLNITQDDLNMVIQAYIESNS